MKYVEDIKPNKQYDTIFIKTQWAKVFYKEYLVAYWEKSEPYIWVWRSMNEAGDTWVIEKAYKVYWEDKNQLDPDIHVSKLTQIPSLKVRFLGKLFKARLYNKLFSYRYRI